jgi:hypothetical protein
VYRSTTQAVAAILVEVSLPALSLQSSSDSPSSARAGANTRRSGGLARLASFDVKTTAVGLSASRYRVLTLPANIIDKATFFAAARATLPLVPALADDKWDALDDSLFEGLLELPEDRVAILWSGAKEMRAKEPDAFSAAIQVLENVARSLLDGNYTLGPPKSVLVVVDT